MNLPFGSLPALLVMLTNTINRVKVQTPVMVEFMQEGQRYHATSVYFKGGTMCIHLLRIEE